MLKLTTDRHEASRGLFATAELLVVTITRNRYRHLCKTSYKMDQLRDFYGT